MLGETYDRLLGGDAIAKKTNPLYLPDDGMFHGIGKRADYKMDNYWDTNHTFNLYNATAVSEEALALRAAKHLPPPSSNLFQDSLNYTGTVITPPPRCYMNCHSMMHTWYLLCAHS